MYGISMAFVMMYIYIKNMCVCACGIENVVIYIVIINGSTGFPQILSINYWLSELEIWQMQKMSIWKMKKTVFTNRYPPQN